MQGEGSKDGGDRVMWASIGGQLYAVPSRRKRAVAAKDASDTDAKSDTPKIEQNQEQSTPDTDSTSQSSSSWSWLGFVAKEVPALNAGLGLAESTLSGLYNAVSSSASYLAEDQPAALPDEQEKAELALTAELVDFVQNVTDHPSTFTSFPVETSKGPQPARLVKEGMHSLSSKQARHATAMLALVPKLQTLRHDLVPGQLTENVFWHVYFSLIDPKTDGIDWGLDESEHAQDEGVEERSDEDQEEVDEKEAETRKQSVNARAQHRREMILGGNDEDDEDEDDDEHHLHGKHPHHGHITLLDLRNVWNSHRNGYTSAAKSSPLYGEDSKRLKKCWEGIVFSGKEPGRLIREQFRHLIRQGIAPSHRTLLWPLMADALVLLRRTPTLYEEALQSVYITEEGKEELEREEAKGKAVGEGGKKNEDAKTETEEASGPKAKEKEESESEAPGPTVRILPALKVPTTFSRIPNFGGKFIAISHWLNSEGTAAAKRLLTVFAIQNPEWDYVPCLPDLVLLLLHYLPEPAVYFAMVSLLNKAIPVPAQQDEQRDGLATSKDGSSQKLRFLNRSKREVETSVCTLVDCLLPHHLPRIHSHITGPCREVMISRDFQKEIQLWMDRLFVSVLPLHSVFKVMDNMLGEGGVAILYQTALRVLQANEDDLLQAADGQEFMKRLRLIAQRYSERDLDDSFLFSDGPLFAELTVAQILQAEAKAKEANPQLETLANPALSASHLPTVKQSSLVISQEQFEVIWQWLPSRYRVKNPVRHFSSSKDGFSVLSVYRQCKQSLPHFFFIKTKQGKIFGAYLTDGWRPSQKFYGSGECFLFTIQPLLRKFAWTAANKELFMIGNEKELIIGGGGGCGIWLDSELWHGTSEYCETFRNDPLNGTSKDFEAVAVEVYGFSS